MICRDHVCPTCHESYEHDIVQAEICIDMRSLVDGKKHLRKCERCMKANIQLTLFKEGQMVIFV